MKQGTLFIISAPSGAGKTSLVEALISQEPFKETLERVITYTTRAPRSGDINGQDYHFIGEADFITRAQKGFFLEWSTAYGTYYGTPISLLEDLCQGFNRVLIIDRLGAGAMVKILPEAVLIWISPPSLEILEARLQVRGTENKAQIARRIALAKLEMEEEAQNPQYMHKITNDFFENSIDFLKNIVIKALVLKK